MEKHVCNLEIAKRLRELGVKQLSQFQWNTETKEVEYFAGSRVATGSTYAFVSAFLASELAEMLRKAAIKKEAEHLISKDAAVWKSFKVVVQEEGNLGQIVLNSVAPNTLGKMLIYLLENNLITLPQDTTASVSTYDTK